MAALSLLVGCGGRDAVPRQRWEQMLAEALRSEVTSREQNRENSREVERALEEGALKDMMRFEVKAAIGQGEPCHAHPECAENGFEADDWYYTVGSGDEEQVGKRPVVIVGFGSFGRVVRTWQLRVH